MSISMQSSSNKNTKTLKIASLLHRSFVSIENKLNNAADIIKYKLVFQIT